MRKAWEEIENIITIPVLEIFDTINGSNENFKVTLKAYLYLFGEKTERKFMIR